MGLKWRAKVEEAGWGGGGMRRLEVGWDLARGRLLSPSHPPPLRRQESIQVEGKSGVLGYLWVIIKKGSGTDLASRWYSW